MAERTPPSPGHVLGGLSLEGLRWAITTDFTNNWHPLTWVSLMLDVELFGADPGRAVPRGAAECGRFGSRRRS